MAPKEDSETAPGSSVIREVQEGQSSEEGDGFHVAFCRLFSQCLCGMSQFYHIFFITVSAFSPPNYLVECILSSPLCNCEKKYSRRLRNLPDFPECCPEARLTLGL